MAPHDNPEHKEHANGHGWGDYGGNPLAHINSTDSTLLPALGATLQPGLYRVPDKGIANPAPLGLAGFALTTFVLSCVNLGVMGLETPAIVIGPAMAYGGLVQLLSGMWEIAVGNTFGGTALSSYGGFWISLAIILTPGFGIGAAYADDIKNFHGAFGFYLFGWTIFTYVIFICTLRSTWPFSILFFLVGTALLCLASSNILATSNATGLPNLALTRAGGWLGMFGAFIAWYLMLAGVMDESNSFAKLPPLHFPWSDKGREGRRAKAKAKTENGAAV